MAAADISHGGTCSAPPETAQDTPRGLTAGSTLTWTTRPGLAKTPKQARDRLPPPDPAEPGEWNRRSARPAGRGCLRPGGCRWLDLGGLSVGDMRQVMSGRAGGRRPYRASWEDRLRKQAGRGGAWLNGCAVDRLAGSRTRTQMKESIAVTEQNGFWPDGAQLAVSVSMQFEAGGQPVSRAGARSPSRSCPASPISGRTASMSTGPARGCPGSWTCWTSTPSR
jgi:hypothetical protein